MKIIISLLFFLMPIIGWGQNVTFINPGYSHEAYWVMATKSMHMAATSLNMNLEVLYLERERTKAIEVAQEIASRPKKTRPDYVVFSNDFGIAPALLKIFNDAKIPSLMVYSSLTAQERLLLGGPRGQYPYWLGSIEPRVQDAGYATARALIEKGRAMRAKGADSKMHLIAIAGDRSTNSSVLRNDGVLRAVNEAGDVKLEQLVYADWNENKAAEQTAWLLQRYPETKLVWAGNDLMAFGAMQAAENRGEIPGKTMLFSGINTSERAFKALNDQRLSALAGGHFVTGAWGLVLIYDYAHGKDFTNEGLELSVPTFILFTPEKVKSFSAKFGDSSRPIDFKKYSKVYSPTLKSYAFGFSSLLN